MYYLESTKTDPSWNLALEQYVFDVLGPRDDCFMLWQNDNTIVVGKHQNTAEEINADFVRTSILPLWRRTASAVNLTFPPSAGPWWTRCAASAFPRRSTAATT